MLKMTDVSKVYPGGSVALQNVDIHIEPGEFVFVVGPSGAGKSTFIKMLFREVLPTTGSIFVNGVDILSLTPNEIPYMRRQLGIIFQDYRLLPDRTVYENVAFAMEVIETPRRKIKRRVLNVLDLVGLQCFHSSCADAVNVFNKAVNFGVIGYSHKRQLHNCSKNQCMQTHTDKQIKVTHQRQKLLGITSGFQNSTVCLASHKVL